MKTTVNKIHWNKSSCILGLRILFTICISVKIRISSKLLKQSYSNDMIKGVYDQYTLHILSLRGKNMSLNQPLFFTRKIIPYFVKN